MAARDQQKKWEQRKKKGHNFILYGWIILHCVHELQFLHPFTGG
jgi:hypothetical protein